MKPPFQADDMKGLFKKVTKGEFPPLSMEFSNDFHSIIAQMLQLDPRKRPTCSQIFRMHFVLKHADVENSEELSINENQLLRTIMMPNDVNQISGRLPKSKYKDIRPNHSEPSPNREFDFNLPKVHKLNKNDSYYRRDSYSRPRYREAISVTNQNNSNLSHQDLLSNKNSNNRNFLRDNYGALKLPRVKYPSQPHPIYSVRQQDILNKPDQFSYVPERRRLLNRNRYN